MTGRSPVVTDTDIALLKTLEREHSVVAASRHVGISRDRATYRIARLGRAFGGPLVRSVRGGRGHGGSALTPLGTRIASRGFDAVELRRPRPVGPEGPLNRLRGIYRSGPPPEIEVGRSVRLRVAFPARDGAYVTVLLDPGAILLARTRFSSSARNLLRARVDALRPGPGPLESTVFVREGAIRLRITVTPEAVRQLRLARGARVWLYVKATALHPVDRSPLTPGSLPK